MNIQVSSNRIISLAEDRIRELDALTSKNKFDLRCAPEGSLRVSVSGKRIQYYCRLKSSEKSGTYIRKENSQLAVCLAQKEYDQKVLSLASAECKLLTMLVNKYPGCWEQVYASLPAEKQCLIQPDYLSDEAFLASWSSVKYSPRIISDIKYPFYSKKNEHMRSKSEVLIANLLTDLDIPYRYEYPLILDGSRTVYPDFTVLNRRTRKELIWEHQGMMSDPAYCKNALAKINTYVKNGYIPGKNLIITQESSDMPLDLSVVKQLISEYLM